MDVADLEDVIRASPARVLPGAFYVIRFAGDVPSPTEQDLAVCRDSHEVTVVTSHENRIELARTNGMPLVGPFSAIRLEVAVPFQAPGFIAAAATANADAGVSVYVISTFSYDYFLIAQADVMAAAAALSRRGFPVLQQ